MFYAGTWSINRLLFPPLVIMWTPVLLVAVCWLHSYVMVCKARFLLCSTLVTTLVSAERLLLREPSSSGGSETCKYWSTAVRSARVIFCQVEPDDALMKSIGSTLPVVLDNNAQASRHWTNEREDYVIFMDSKGENILEDCISEAIPSRLLTQHTAVIVCDRSTDFPRKLQKTKSLKFLERASVLYLTATECWSASPFYFLNRSFTRESNCYGTQWRYDWKRLPDMQGQALRVVIRHGTFFTVIKENESRPESKTCIFYNI